MNDITNVKTLFKAYRIAKISLALKEPNVRKNFDEVESFIAKQEEYLRTLPLRHINPAIDLASNNLRHQIRQENYKLRDYVNDQKATEKPTTKFYNDALNAAIEEISADGVYVKNNTMFFRGENIIDFQKEGRRETIESALTEAFAQVNLPKEAFDTHLYISENDETVVQVRFPGYSIAREAIFDAVKTIDNTTTTIYSVNGKGLDISLASKNDTPYRVALRNEGKTVSEGLYLSCQSELDANAESFIAKHASKFEKTYQKWESVAYANKEVFNFDMVR